MTEPPRGGASLRKTVRFIDSQDMLVVAHACKVCRVTQAEIDSNVIVVSPRGTAHHGDEYGMTVCGKDATRDGWWWPL